MNETDPHSDEIPEPESEWKYDLAIDLLLAFGVALNVYFIVDVATDGKLSAEMATRMRTVAGRMRVALGVIRHRDRVIEEAHEALYTEDDTEK